MVRAILPHPAADSKQVLNRRAIFRGETGVELHGSPGLRGDCFGEGSDIAFWDLRGKALGKTVQELLGGSRERVPAYASALLWTDSLESLGREAAGYVDQGYRRVKMRMGKDET